MPITELIKNLASIIALVIGITYIIGGLIVNLYLTRYGVTEYQILRVKFLVVGLVYIANAISIFALAATPAIFLIAINQFLQQGLFVVSLISSVLLLWLWAKSIDTNKKPKFRPWRIWVALGTLSSIFPLVAIIRLAITGLVDIYSWFLSVEAILAGVLTIIGQVYYYARYLYGRPNLVLGASDPVGMGTPVNVQLAGEEKNMSYLQNLGVPFIQANVTDEVLLLDETDKEYIIGVITKTSTQAIKVSKDIIKAIIYLSKTPS